MRELKNDNVNLFLGIVLNSQSTFLSVWKYCQRGSLGDVISSRTLNKDAFFVFSIIKDIASVIRNWLREALFITCLQGLAYLHHSFLGRHGNLTSDTCLVDSRWQVKLSGFGLTTIRQKTRWIDVDRAMLWMAPEILRNIDSNAIAGKEADVYSFSIVCSEIITKHPPFAFNNDGNEQLPGLILKCITCLFDFSEIIHLIKRGSSPAFRPQLNVNDTADINPAMVLFTDI